MFFFLRLMLNRLMESMYMKTNFVEIDFLSSQAGKLIMPCLSQQVCNLSFFKHFLSLFRTNEKKMNSLDYIKCCNVLIKPHSSGDVVITFISCHKTCPFY